MNSSLWSCTYRITVEIFLMSFASKITFLMLLFFKLKIPSFPVLLSPASLWSLRRFRLARFEMLRVPESLLLSKYLPDTAQVSSSGVTSRSEPVVLTYYFEWEVEEGRPRMKLNRYCGHITNFGCENCATSMDFTDFLINFVSHLTFVIWISEERH